MGFVISYQNKKETVKTNDFNEAIKIAVSVSNNIPNISASVVQVNEENETAEVNVYVNNNFDNCENIYLQREIQI